MYSSRIVTLSDVWMIFWNAKFAQARGEDSGRHRAVGSSLDALPRRCFTSASAQGCMGSTSLGPEAMLTAAMPHWIARLME